MRLQPKQGPMVLAGLVLFATAATAATAGTAPPAVAPARTFAALPLHFEANQGQFPSPVRYAARGPDYQLLLTADEALMSLARSSCAADGAPRDAAPIAIRTRLLGANAAARSAVEQPLPGRSHYLLGENPKDWKRNIAQYARLRYAAVYPGIDLVYHGSQGQLEFDFIVAPDHDPGVIRLDYRGVERAERLANGDLALHTAAGAVTLRRPVAYQDIDGERREVSADFRVSESAERIELAFALGDYDRDAVLVIDPVVVFSTYMGARREDEVNGIAVDAAGNVYVTGAVQGPDFTTVNALQPVHGGDYDGFVAKLSPDGSTLLYATYFGSVGFEYGQAIAVDAAGSAFVSGYTSSTHFPAGSLRPYAGNGDAFLAKLAPDGSSILWSTVMGGAESYDYGNSLALDASGNPHLAGITWSSDFPVLNAMQRLFGGGSFDGYAAKFAGDTGALLWSTFIGGSGEDWARGIALDASGRVYLAGATTSTDFPTRNPLQAQNGGATDAFVARLSISGRALSYSTYLGGPGIDTAAGIAVDPYNAAHIAGHTNSPDFPTLNSLQPFSSPYTGELTPTDAFVAKLRPDGSALQWSTFVGSSGIDNTNGIALDAARNVHVVGTTLQDFFPTDRPFPAVKPLQAYGGGWDAFIFTLPPNGRSLRFSSWLGSQGHDFGYRVAATPEGEILLAGRTTGGWPVVEPVQPSSKGAADGFITRISPSSDSVPDVVEFVQESFVISEEKIQAVVRATRSGTGYGVVYARIATSDGTATAGSDYTAQDAAVFWAHGQTGVRRYTIPIANDGVVEGAETVNLSMLSVHGYATVGPLGTATLRIKDPAPAP